MNLPFAENYRIKMVEPVYRSTRQEREVWIKEAKYNLFKLQSNRVFVDLLTDSGTGAMSDRQWGAIMTGDESYAGSASFYQLKEKIEELFGFPYFLPVHQGRAAENVLFSALMKEEGLVVPGNSHFDTTKGHIEFRKAQAVDCTIDEAFDTESPHDFKGNIDIDKLKQTLNAYPSKRVPFIIVTVTCNSSGGQPVSMANIKSVAEVARQYGIPIIFDSARFAENAWFIKEREPGYADKPVKEIVREMFSYADGMTMSCKKDGIVNIGGFIAMRHKEWYQQASVYNIMYEGYLTYGGMAGRDMNALAVGLEEVTQCGYLETRINQVRRLGEQLIDAGIPVQKPIGGHAVFVDALKFLPNVPRNQFIAQTLAIELYLDSGVRGVEVGSLMADKDPETGEERFPKLEFLRLAIPRRTYTDNHLNYVAASLIRLYKRREQINGGFKITFEAPVLRHFTVELEKASCSQTQDSLVKEMKV